MLPVTEQIHKTPQQLDKEQRVHKMFAGISRRYDLLNMLLSAGRDRGWRAFAVQQCHLQPGDLAVDVCAGTADIAIDLACAVGREGRITAVDFTHEMMAVGQDKVASRGLASRIEFVQANAESMPFADDTFAAATNGFALRNVGSIERALLEMRRVVKPGGRVVVLELARPQLPVIKSLYEPYFYHVLPLIGGLISGNPKAYRYLPNSLNALPSRQHILALMATVGLRESRCYEMTLGVATVFVGIKG